MNWLKDEIKTLTEQNLFRSEKIIESAQGPHVTIDGKDYILFCSNNYLGLANHPEVKHAAISAVEKYGVGSGASRLVSGTSKLHKDLEEKLAELKKTESAILFPTGYMANVGTISALAGKEDVVIIDKLNHASIIDGCRLSGAKLLVYPHKKVEKLIDILKKCSKHRRRLVITDTIFSMDGDVAPVDEIQKACKEYDAMLMIDDAHSTGIFPPHKADIIMGTLSKAIGSLGGFVCGSKDLTDYLRNKARSYIYTTSMPPALCAAAIESINIIQNEPERITRLWDNVKTVKDGLKNIGFNLGQSQSQIIPIIIGNNDKTLAMSKYLFENGIFVQAIRHPTVPKGKERLRLTVMSEYMKKDLGLLIKKIKFIGSG